MSSNNLPSTIKKTTQLKNLIQSKDLTFLMEAHNGLSAKIAQQAGFSGIWGSGLSISASLGVRDNNEASWTQVLEVVEFMSDATHIPILLDGDTGYGNFNNMRRLVNKLESRGVAGVCIEDKIFPKTNSFLREERQPLADMEEFAGKIKAGLDARKDDDFCVVARIESFISGWGLEETLKRAHCYHRAGATALLIHSKKSNASEIFAFMKEWKNLCPVIIVPTKYYATPTQEFRDQGISTVIWANHLMRSAITSMQSTAKKIFQSQSLMDVEEKVAPLKEVFRLQDDEELSMAEKKYLPINAKEPKEVNAIILAASRGEELGDLTLHRPKSLIQVGDESLFSKIIKKFEDFGVKNLITVRGYKKESFPIYNGIYIDNDNYQNSSELYSLDLGLAQFKGKGEFFITYGDLFFRSFLLNMLDSNPSNIKIIVDNSQKKDAIHTYKGDFVQIKSNKLMHAQFSSIKSDSIIDGEWIGLLMANTIGMEWISLAINELKKREDFNQLKMDSLFNQLIAMDFPISVEYIQGHWLDVDNIQDFEKIQGF